MNLAEFRDMWSDCKLIEEDRRMRDGATWILYSVTEIESTNNYGRHYAIFVVIRPDDKEVIAHNLHNTTDRDTTPYRQQIWEWWEKHLAEGLVDPAGKKIEV